MRLWHSVALLLFVGCLAGEASAQNTISNLPRKETLIVENPEGTIKNAGWFNIWAINAGGQSTGLHQLGMDTFWYIDPQKGVDGVWDNSLASDKPIYNADFTEMTVKLRKGIFWSDGVEFSADDVLYTIQTHMKTNGLRWSAPVQVNVADVSAPDDSTVVFKLKKPNSRFHALFTVRWNAMWMMPKHVFEKAGDPLKFAFDPPVTLGAYTLQFLRSQRQVVHLAEAAGLAAHDGRALRRARARSTSPMSIPGPPDKRVIAQMNHELDIIHDVSPEGMFTLAKQSKTSHGWFKGFPYAHPDPTLPAVVLQRPERDVQEPRRALGAGAADRHQGGVDGVVPRRRDHLGDRRAADRLGAGRLPRAARGLAEGLRDRHRQAQAEAVRSRPSASRSPTCLRPSLGEQIPSSADEIAKSFGRGWWKPNPQAAQELLERAGYSKKGDKWFMPDGKPFAIRLMVEGEGRPVMTRAGSMIAQQWRQFGIDATTVVAQGSMVDRRAAGDFEAMITWSVETWGGHPDLSFFLDSWHSQFVAAARQAAAAAQLAALDQPRARQDHRAGPPDRLRRSQGPRARPRVREARGARDADHSADVVQRLHRDGRHLLDRLPERRDGALHRSGAQLGQHQVHDGEAEAEAVKATERTQTVPSSRPRPEGPRGGTFSPR